MKSGIFFSIICALLMFFILLFPADAIASAAASVTLWSTSVFPSLFPFFVLTSILKQTGMTEALIYRSSKNLDYNLVFTTVIGLMCGYPSTSKLIGQSDTKNPVPIYALSTCASPVFIIGTVATAFLQNTRLAVYILVATYLSLATSYIITKAMLKSSKASRPAPPILSNKPLGSLITTAIMDGLKSQGIILGIIIVTGILSLALDKAGFFTAISVPLTPIAKLLGIPKSCFPAFFKGLIEMTTGTNAICAQSITTYHKLLFCGFLTSFGGMSIIIESLAFINEKIKATSIIGVKMLHGILTCLYLRLLLWIFPLSQSTALTASTVNINGFHVFICSCALCTITVLSLRRILRRGS